MRRRFGVAVVLLALGVVFADSGKLPIVEDDVVREVEALIDRTPELTDKEAEDVHKLIKRGSEAHDARRYDEALGYYRKALSKNPVSAHAYYEMAFTLSETGDQAGALDNVVRALVIDPKNEQGYVLKGNVLDNLGFPEEAKKTYLTLLSVQPASYMGHLNLGICDIRLGDNKAGRVELIKARDLSPERASPYFYLGTIARLDGCDYEEHDNFTKFLEVGKNDPRGETVHARLKELQQLDVQVDPGDTSFTVSMAEQLARVAWRTTTHRQRHPDACGYALTFEEEKEILSQVVIPEWRKLKAANAEAKSPRYDVLLAIDDAGFLDEYIYATKGKALGDSATKWLADHPDRKRAFEDWARKEGYLAESGPARDARSIPGEVFAAMEASKVHYLVEVGTAADSDRFLAAERARFRVGVKLQGDDEVDCASAESVPGSLVGSVGARVLLPVFRCKLPGDEAFDKSAKLVSVLGLVVRDLAPAVEGAAFTDKDTVHIKIVNPSWLGYVTAKAAWRHEPELRKRYEGGESDAPSIEEELFAFGAASAGYRNGRAAPAKDGQSFQAVESLDRLAEIDEAGHLRGFVLYEVLHRRYGLSLKSLAAADARAVADYLLADVFVKAADRH